MKLTFRGDVRPVDGRRIFGPASGTHAVYVAESATFDGENTLVELRALFGDERNTAVQRLIGKQQEKERLIRLLG